MERNCKALATRTGVEMPRAKAYRPKISGANSLVNKVSSPYYQLEKMMTYRPPLPSGKSIHEINEIAQKILPGLVQILINGYGDRDQGWETSLFAH